MSKSLLVVTGASRGIGRAAAVGLSRRLALPDECCLRALFIARCGAGLEKTKEMVHSAVGTRAEVEVASLDLSDLDAVGDAIPALLRGLVEAGECYSHAVLINNAGSLGTLGPSESLHMGTLRPAFDLNITSCSFVSSQFASHFAKSGTATKCTIVNISSLAAVSPFPTWGTYCAGKAARDMFHSVLAEEMADRKGVTVINYAPGAVETEMQVEIRGNETGDLAIREQMVALKERGELVDPEETVDVLCRLVMGDTKVESGAHVDYWDVKGE